MELEQVIELRERRYRQLIRAIVLMRRGLGMDAACDKVGLPDNCGTVDDICRVMDLLNFRRGLDGRLYRENYRERSERTMKGTK